MPILDGFGATRKIREFERAHPLRIDAIRPSTDLNDGIPIFAVSASLKESQREFMMEIGMDGWILKPIDFKRLGVLLSGITDVPRRQIDLYDPKGNWELGGWMKPAVVSAST